MKRFLTLILLVSVLMAGCEFFFEDPEVLAAIKTGDPSECEKLIDDDDSRANRCLRQMAEDKGDAAICARISEKNTEETCIGDVAGATGDESVCEQAINKDSCYAQAASFDNDIDVCKKIVEESAQFRCVRYAAANSGQREICDSYSGDKYYECVSVFADKNGGEHCNDPAFTDKQIGECLYLATEIAVDDCRAIAGKPGVKQDYQSCLRRAAVKEGKATVCMELETNQKDCVKRVAREHDEPNACERLSGAEMDECFYEYGSYENEPKVCKKIVDSELKKQCEEEAE